MVEMTIHSIVTQNASITPCEEIFGRMKIRNIWIQNGVRLATSAAASFLFAILLHPRTGVGRGASAVTSLVSGLGGVSDLTAIQV